MEIIWKIPPYDINLWFTELNNQSDNSLVCFFLLPGCRTLTCKDGFWLCWKITLSCRDEEMLCDRCGHTGLVYLHIKSIPYHCLWGVKSFIFIIFHTLIWFNMMKEKVGFIVLMLTQAARASTGRRLFFWQYNQLKHFLSLFLNIHSNY